MKLFKSTKLTFSLIKRNFGPFMRFEILYKVISFLIFFPLLDKLERLSLRLAGVYYISNYNLRMVLKQPVTWVTVVIILLALAIYIAVEFFGLSYCADASFHNRRTGALEMLAAGFRKSMVMLEPRNWLFIIYVFLILPIADLYEAFTAASNFSVPGYLIERLLRNDKYFPYLIAAIIILAVLALCLLFVIPFMAILNDDFIPAARKSVWLAGRHIIRVLITSVLWIAVIAGVFAGAFGLELGIIKLVLMWLEPSMAKDITSSPEVMLVAESVIFLIFTWFIAPLIITRVQVAFYGYLVESKGDIPEFNPDYGSGIRRVWVRAALAGGIVLCLYFFVPERYQQIKTTLLYGGRDTMIMAHRGDSAHAPENTLPAFQQAINHGADAAELDVQMTKDGTIIVMHDSSLKRTTGLNKNVWQVTYDQIRDLDSGSFFDEKYQFTRIPTLDQVLKLCKGKLYLNIEIKRTGHDDGIVEKTLEIIEANQYEKDCDITSFDYNTLRKVKDLNPKIYTVYTTTVGGGSLAKLTYANAFSVDSNFVTPGFVQYMRKSNKGIYVWTVDNYVTMGRMIDMNVDAIITNDVELGREVKNTNKGVAGTLRRLQRTLLAF